MEFTVHLYRCSNCTYLNDLRSKKAASNITAKKLPPTEDSFHLHLLWCVYQLALWRQAVHPVLEMPTSAEYGYELDVESQSYCPQLMSQG